MGSFRPDRRVFRRGDKVLGYWVDHAEGFEVRSGARRRARVDAIVIDPRLGRARALVVRSTRLHRRRLIPVEAVVAVDPFARRLEVERAHRRSLSRRLTRLAAPPGCGSASRQTVAQLAGRGFGVALRFGRALATERVEPLAGPRLSAAARGRTLPPPCRSSVPGSRTSREGHRSKRSASDASACSVSSPPPRGSPHGCGRRPKLSSWRPSRAESQPLKPCTSSGRGSHVTCITRRPSDATEDQLQRGQILHHASFERLRFAGPAEMLTRS